MVKIVPLIAALALAACAPGASNYAGQPGSPQAFAKCRAQSWGIAASQSGNALLAGAMQSQYIGDCMRASGYEMR